MSPTILYIAFYKNKQVSIGRRPNMYDNCTNWFKLV